MHNTITHCIVLELCVTKRKVRKKQRKKINKIKIFMFGFFNLIKISVTYIYSVDLALEQQKIVVCMLFALLCFIFLGAALIPYDRRAF